MPYSFAPARGGLTGCLDKTLQFEAMAARWGGRNVQGRIDSQLNKALADHQFRELVIGVVRPQQNRALDQQLQAWERFCENLPYFREPGEVVANPLETARRGGDCDDLAALALAGYYCLGVPQARAEVLADEKGRAYHVRCRVPVPAVGPVQGFRVFDPTWHSEERWARPSAASARQQPLPAPQATAGSSDSPGVGLGTLWLAVGLAGLAGWWLRAPSR